MSSVLVIFADFYATFESISTPFRLNQGLGKSEFNLASKSNQGK